MGELAALLTAISWGFTSIFISDASKVIGSRNVNRARIALATVFLVITHLILQKQILPLDASPDRWFWLGLSGIVGLIIGDGFLFQSYVLIGPRLGMLIMASVPIISSFFAWIFLGETLSIVKIIGILISITGIAVVVYERYNGNESKQNRRNFILGILAGFGGAFGQAVGLILAKQGLIGDFPAISGVVIRMLISTIIIWAIAFIKKEALNTLKKSTSDWKVSNAIIAGTFVGPFIGVWLSLIAVQSTYVGVASTLMALTPIFMLPLARWLYKERISLTAIIGTIFSIIGVAIIFIL